VMSSLWQAHHPVDRAVPSAEQRILPKTVAQQAKV
jgi:hypothetical protein